MSEADDRRHFDDRLVVRDGRHVNIVFVRDIDWIESAGNYVKLHVAGEVLRMRGTLQALEQRLDPVRFVRIHRSVLVNGDRMRRITPWFNGGACVELVDGTRLNLSRSQRQAVDRFLDRYSP